MAEKEKGNIVIICDNVHNLESIGGFCKYEGYTQHIAVLTQDSDNATIPTAGELLADLAQKQIPIVAFVISDPSMSGYAQSFSWLWKDAKEVEEGIRPNVEKQLSEMGVSVTAGDPVAESLKTNALQEGLENMAEDFIQAHEAVARRVADRFLNAAIDFGGVGSVPIIKALRQEGSPFRDTPIVVQCIYGKREQEFVDAGATIITEDLAYVIALKALDAKREKPEITFQAAFKENLGEETRRPFYIANAPSVRS